MNDMVVEECDVCGVLNLCRVVDGLYLCAPCEERAAEHEAGVPDWFDSDLDSIDEV